MEKATSPLNVTIPQVRRARVRIDWRLVTLIAAMAAIAVVFGSLERYPNGLNWLGDSRIS